MKSLRRARLLRRWRGRLDGQEKHIKKMQQAAQLHRLHLFRRVLEAWKRHHVRFQVVSVELLSLHLWRVKFW